MVPPSTSKENSYSSSENTYDATAGDDVMVDGINTEFSNHEAYPFDDEFDQGESLFQVDKLWAALSYPIPFIAILALNLDDKKNIPFVRFHAVQSIAFSIILWGAIILLGVITLGLGWICAPVFLLISLWPAYDSYQGNYTELPVITNFIKDRGWVR